MEPESAKLGSARETPLGLNRNHSNICKFSRLDDPAYQEAVGPNLQSMAENARSRYVQCNHDAIENHGKLVVLTKNRIGGRKASRSRLMMVAIGSRSRRPVLHASSIAGAPPSVIGLSGRNHWVNRFPRCEPFIGREDLMNDICEMWNKWDSPMPRRISLSGNGSVGYEFFQSIRSASKTSQVHTVANFGIVRPS